MSAFTICHLEELERPFPKWALARKTLGVNAFGINVVELPPGETIPEHTEVERDQEEVFLTMKGEVTMVIDGRDHPAPTGTFVRLDPEPMRTIRNDGPGSATVLVVSAPRTSGYQPMGWA